MQMLKNNLNKGEIKMKKTTTYKVTAYNKDGDYYDYNILPSYIFFIL